MHLCSIINYIIIYNISVKKKENILDWILENFLEHHGFWPREVSLPTQPNLGEVIAGSWL